MHSPRVDYDRIAQDYHSRYDGRPLAGIREALLRLALSGSPRRVLEAGCGTGHWIECLRAAGVYVVGADASPGMLQEAARRLGPDGLVAARANELPFQPASFELILAVNAIHHFDNPRDFLARGHALLAPGGMFASIGIDPRTIRRRYHYEYFDGALDLDLRRYPPFGHQVNWMIETGFSDVKLCIVENSVLSFTGREVLSDPFIRKTSNSLLALLADEVYEDGLRRIEAATAGAEARGEQIEFRSELPFGMVTGRRAA